MSKPICFADSAPDGRLHPVDEQAFVVFAAEMYKRFVALPPGRHFEFVGSREKGGSQRIDGYFDQRAYPLHDETEESVDFPSHPSSRGTGRREGGDERSDSDPVPFGFCSLRVCGEPRREAMTEPTYPCDQCGKPRTKAEGGTVFTVCDACWPKPSEQKIPPATDEEIESFYAGPEIEPQGIGWYCRDCRAWWQAKDHETIPHNSLCGSVIWPRIKARIDADREKIAALEAERDELVKLTVPSDSDAEEKANLRALNAEAALRDLVSAALTDSDACSICLHGTPGHLSGCAKASAEALIAKAEGKAR